MANGDGTYNNPIIVDGLIKKDGKIYKLNTGNTKNCVKSVNNIKPDENGNVVVPELDKVDIENSITEIKKKNAEQDTALSNAKQELSDKCDASLSNAKTYTDEKTNDALTNAKTYTDQEKAKYLPLSGGKVQTTYFDSGTGAPISQLSNSEERGMFIICSGTSNKSGACLYLNGIKDTYQQAGSASIITVNPSDGEFFFLRISPISRDLLTSDGYIPIASYNKYTDTIHSVAFKHGIKIQCVRIYFDTDGFQAVNWDTPFKDANYHVFVMSEDPDNNLAFQIASVSNLNKTSTTVYVSVKIEAVNGYFKKSYISVLGIGKEE